MNVLVRDAETTDIPAILRIVNHAIEHTTANYDYLPHSLEQELEWFADKKAKGFPVFVAVENEKVCGFGTYGPFRFKYGYRFTVEHSVYVAPGSIGKGIGSLLLERLIASATESGYHLMIGGIDASNHGSIAFHEKFGFETCGIIREAAFKFDRWLDLMFMSRKLS